MNNLQAVSCCCVWKPNHIIVIIYTAIFLPSLTMSAVYNLEIIDTSIKICTESVASHLGCHGRLTRANPSLLYMES